MQGALSAINQNAVNVCISKIDLGEVILFMFLKVFHKTSDRNEEEGRLAKKKVPEHCPGTCL